MTAMSDDERDVVVLAGPTQDDKGARVVRFKGDEVSFGEVRAAEDGKPLHGAEVVRLTPREGAPRVCDVEVLHAPPARKGPAKVTSEPYRQNWDAIFGAGSDTKSLN
jgi:hypothetical protein